MTGYSMIQEILGETEGMAVGYTIGNQEDLRNQQASWVSRRRESTIRKVLSMAGKLQQASYVVRPGQLLVLRLLLLANLHLTKKELRGAGDALGRKRRGDKN